MLGDVSGFWKAILGVGAYLIGNIIFVAILRSLLHHERGPLRALNIVPVNEVSLKDVVSFIVRRNYGMLAHTCGVYSSEDVSPLVNSILAPTASRAKEPPVAIVARPVVTGDFSLYGKGETPELVSQPDKKRTVTDSSALR